MRLHSLGTSPGNLIGRLLSLGVMLLISSQARPQGFSAFVAHLYSIPTDQRQAAVDSFLAVTTQYPLIEDDTLAHFLYTGTPSSVTVPGDANGWSMSAFAMSRVQGTTLWYFTRSFESDARLDYKFVLNGSSWILDPRNPRQVSGGFGPNSELQMPHYVPPPEILFYGGIPHGSLRDTTFSSVILGNSRTVRVYTPPGYEASSGEYPVAYFHDGLEYVSLASANNTIDYLLSQNRIEPIIAVFIPPVNRTSEYAGSQISAFSQFMVNEIVPYIDARYRTRKSPSSRSVLGASYGGNISLWLGYHYPETFGNIGAYSSYIADSLKRGFAESPAKELVLYLDLGTYDIASLLPMVRSFVPILASKGYPYEYREYHEGHSWGNWRAHVDNALELFYGTATSVPLVQDAAQNPTGLQLSQNYPNPFNPTTRFACTISKSAFVEVAVYDLLGRLIETVFSGELQAGTHTLLWNAAGRPSGVYFYQVRAGDLLERRRMLLLR